MYFPLIHCIFASKWTSVSLEQRHPVFFWKEEPTSTATSLPAFLQPSNLRVPYATSLLHPVAIASSENPIACRVFEQTWELIPALICPVSCLVQVCMKGQSQTPGSQISSTPLISQNANPSSLKTTDWAEHAGQTYCSFREGKQWVTGAQERWVGSGREPGAGKGGVSVDQDCCRLQPREEQFPFLWKWKSP